MIRSFEVADGESQRLLVLGGIRVGSLPEIFNGAAGSKDTNLAVDIDLGIRLFHSVCILIVELPVVEEQAADSAACPLLYLGDWQPA